MEEERDYDREANSHQNGDSSNGWTGPPQDMDLSSAYATLLDQYRDALARIHVLEMQNQNLANMVKWSPPPIESHGGPASIGASEAIDLTARIRAMEGRLAKSNADGSGPDADGRGTTSESRDEIAQLRIQVQALLGQLSKVTGRARHDRMKWAWPRNGGSYRSSSGRGWLNKILKR